MLSCTYFSSFSHHGANFFMEDIWFGVTQEAFSRHGLLDENVKFLKGWFSDVSWIAIIACWWRDVQTSNLVWMCSFHEKLCFDLQLCAGCTSQYIQFHVLFVPHSLLPKPQIVILTWQNKQASLHVFMQTLPKAPIRKLAILRLDGDFYKSTMDGLNNLYNKIVPGGFCIVDDYHAFVVSGNDQVFLFFLVICLLDRSIHWKYVMLNLYSLVFWATRALDYY